MYYSWLHFQWEAASSKSRSLLNACIYICIRIGTFRNMLIQSHSNLFNNNCCSWMWYMLNMIHLQYHVLENRKFDWKITLLNVYTCIKNNFPLLSQVLWNVITFIHVLKSCKSPNFAWKEHPTEFCTWVPPILNFLNYFVSRSFQHVLWIWCIYILYIYLKTRTCVHILI